MGAHAGRRTAASGAAAAAAGLVVLLACVVGPVTGFAPARGAALAGGLQLRSREPCVSRNSVGLLRQRAKDRTRLARRLVRRTTAVQATPAEETAKPAEELASEALRQTVVVEASMDHCFNVASNLDAYRQWCAKGGMKQVEVLLRNDDNLATKVKVRACPRAARAWSRACAAARRRTGACARLEEHAPAPRTRCTDAAASRCTGRVSTVAYCRGTTVLYPWH
jgi:hypothetical protein